MEQSTPGPVGKCSGHNWRALMACGEVETGYQLLSIPDEPVSWKESEMGGKTWRVCVGVSGWVS